MTSLLRKIVFYPVLVIAYAWATLVLVFSPALPLAGRMPAAGVFIGLVILSFIWGKKVRLLRIASILSFALVIVLWLGITPSNDRNWTPDAATLPWAEVKGDEITLHNIRNFNYRSETDFDLNYYSKTVKLSELSEGNIIASYWAGKAIAHIMISFGFNDRDFLTFSIETRKESGEEYSSVSGFFRNYELMYVVADERDVLRLRTNFRNPPEQVYVLRTDTPLENLKKLFMQYVLTINSLRETPEFYNSLTTNCTTRILMHARTYATRARYNWKILASGYVPDYLYEIGALAKGYEFEELMQKSLINERSLAAGLADDYSLKIREGIPRPKLVVLNPNGEVIRE